MRRGLNLKSKPEETGKLSLKKPDAKTAAKIDKAVKHAEKIGEWISDKELRPHAHGK